MNTTNKNKPLFTQKTLLVILSIFVSSCYKGGITRDIQNVSCVFNDSITQEEKRLPIPPPPHYKDNIYKIYTLKMSYGYCKYVKNIKLGVTKYISYDSLGKIKSVISDIGSFTNIGREFRYDENGNITEITNHDKEGKLCAFQIMAIAKKYVGKNVDKETPDWSIDKNINKNGNSRWVVYYDNRRGKTKALVIDPITGKILRELRVVLALDCDPTTNNNDIDEYNE